MAQNLNSTVNINVTANTSQAERQIRELGNEIERINGISAQNNAFAGQFDLDTQDNIDNTSDSIAGLSTNIIKSGAAIGGFKKLFSEANNLLNETVDIVEAVGFGIGDLIVDGTELAVDSLIELVNVTNNAIEVLQELATIGAEIQESYFTVFNYLGDEAGTELVVFTDNLEELYGLNADSLIGGMRGILGMVSNMNTTMEESVRIAEAFTNFGNDLAAFSGYDFEEVVGQLESAINLGSIRVTSPIVRALDMTAEDVEVFRQFNTVEERAQFLLAKGEKVRGTYEKWLQTAGGKVQSFNISTDILSNSISKLSTGVFAMFAPALTKVSELLNNIINKIYMLLKIDVTTADGNMAESMNDIADSIENVGSAATNTEKKLAKFDDVIQINSNSDNDSVSGGLSAEEWEEVLAAFGNLGKTNENISEFDKAIDSIWESINAGDWEGAGLKINNLMREILDIDWSNIKNGAIDIGSGLAQIINGINNNAGLAYDIGKSLSEILNTGILFAGEFAKELDWSFIGSDLAYGWTGFWENFDSTELGEAIASWFKGGFEAASTFITDMFTTRTLVDTDNDEIGDTLMNNFELTGFKLADVINSFFYEFSEEDLNNAVIGIIGFIDGIFETIGKFLETIDLEDIKKKLKDLITKLIKSFSNNAEEWGTILGELINTILDLGSELIKTADEAGLDEAIKKFLEKIDLGGILKKWFELKFDTWLLTQKATLPAKIEALGTGLAAALATVVGGIVGIIIGAIVLVLGGIWEAIKYLAGVIGDFFSWLWGIMTEAKTNVEEFFNAIGKFIGAILITIGKTIGDKLSEIFTSVSNWWSGVTAWWSGIDTWLAGIVDDIAAFGSSVIDTIKKAFDPDTWVEFGKGAFQGLWDGLSSIWTSIKNWWNNNIAGDLIDFDLPDILGGYNISLGIPKLAKGGIATRSTLANIGEAGKEAVLPLENNTGWMDDLAAKLAVKINNGSAISSQSIVIDMSGYIKNVYTRAELLEFAELVVEALKLYGANVSMSY